MRRIDGQAVFTHTSIAALLAALLPCVMALLVQCPEVGVVPEDPHVATMWYAVIYHLRDARADAAFITAGALAEGVRL